MITSIFSKSKPINFIIVFFITLLAFVVANLKLLGESISMAFVLRKIVLFFVCYLSILVVNFIVGKNKLTQNNNFEVLLFSLFLLAIPQTVSNSNVICANFFVILGLRRLISLGSQTNINKKLFDAALWIGVATLFYFWAILFFVLILITLLLYTDNKVKHWLIPFSGLATVFILVISASVIWYNSFFDIFESLPEVSYSFSDYNSLPFIIAITMLCSFGVWSSFFYMKSIKQKKKAFRPSFTVVLVAVIIGFVIVVLAPQKIGSEFLFMLAPLAIIITNYIEGIEEKWFKEVFLSVLVVVPFVLLML